MKNIFTAQKTVLALAVAGLMSSGAFAASQSFSEVTIGEGTAISVNGNQLTDTKVTGTVEGKLTEDGKTATFKDGDSTTDIDLNGGSFSVSAVAEDKTASPVVNAAAGSYTLESLGEHATGTLNITALNSSKAGEAKSATLTIKDGVFNKGDLVINFAHLGTETAEKGQAILKADSNKDMVFGAAEDVDKDTGLIKSPAKLTTFVVTADTDALVDGGSKKVTLANVAINNAGTLTFKTTSTDGIDLSSDVDLSGSTGVTIFDGASTIGGDFTGSKVVMGDTNADNEKNFNQIFTGDVTVNDGVFTAQDMTVTGNQLKVENNGKLVVNGTMTVSGGLGGANNQHHLFYGTQVFNDFVIATTDQSSGAAYVNVGTNGNNNNKQPETVFEAQSLKMSAVSGKEAGFWINDGTVTLGTVEVGAYSTFGTWGGETTINTLSASGGKVDMGSGETAINSLTVTKDATFEAKGGKTEIGDVSVNNGGEMTISSGEVALTGKLTVAEDDATTQADESGLFSMTGGTLTTAGANLLCYDSSKDEFLTRFP